MQTDHVKCESWESFSSLIRVVHSVYTPSLCSLLVVNQSLTLDWRWRCGAHKTLITMSVGWVYNVTNVCIMCCVVAVELSGSDNLLVSCGPLGCFNHTIDLVLYWIREIMNIVACYFCSVVSKLPWSIEIYKERRVRLITEWCGLTMFDNTATSISVLEYRTSPQKLLRTAEQPLQLRMTIM